MTTAASQVAASLPGLTSADAARRLAEAGPNEIEKRRIRTLPIIIVDALREPMFVLLLAGTVIYLLIGDVGEGIFLFVGANLSLAVVVAQEARGENAVRALRNMAQPYAHVVRDNQQQRIAARDLAPGDLILVQEGERVPADGVLLAGDILSVDESVLTGEAVAVLKTPGSQAQGDKGSLLLAGTMVVSGAGLAQVTATGPQTKFGQIGASLSGASEALTPLQATARRLVGYLAIAASAFCVVVFLAYGLNRGDWLQAGLTALTVAISMLPEEFPMALAVFLALGAWRLARHNVLVRRAAAIEALGGVTILCVDKTGTLTENEMRLTRAWAHGAEHQLAAGAQVPAPLGALLRFAALASGVRAVDPMDRAVLAAASPEACVGCRQVKSWPLTPERLAVVQLWREADEFIAAAKGAPEAIFRLCRLDGDQRARLEEVLAGMAGEGARVLGVASACPATETLAEPEDAAFTFEGFIGFVDPLRADAAAALAEAREASIKVAMITGDHPTTARAIAREAGIDVSAGVLTGQELEGLDEAELRVRLASVRVFARIAPDQKLRIVQALRANGEVVAMTGDGVNDSPALQAAHVGIAMGRRGSDVAREAADIVLLDDSIASVVGGVRLGRRIFANLRKALIFITAVHVPLAGLALFPILLGWPPLLLAMQIVLLELVIDPACSLVFEAEPSGADAMRRPPRKPDEMLLGPGQIVLAVAQGVVILIAIGSFYGWALQEASETAARGAGFTGLIAANLALALGDSTAGKAGLFHRSRAVFWALVVAAVLVLAATFWAPGLSAILQMSAPSPSLLAIGLAIGVGSGGWFGAAKAFHRAVRSIGVSAGSSRPSAPDNA